MVLGRRMTRGVKVSKVIRLLHVSLRLDNTTAWVSEVNPSILVKEMTENVIYTSNES